MALELFMIGLPIHDMGKSLEFYRDSVWLFLKEAKDRRMSRSRWAVG